MRSVGINVPAERHVVAAERHVAADVGDTEWVRLEQTT
jgi:hypothetical protein